MKIRFLGHSGFWVEMPGHILIFDYVEASAGASRVETREFGEKAVWVFASHSHGDHYDPAVLTWRRETPNIRYIFSGDIRTREPVDFVEGGETLEMDGVTVRALTSTDLGVAFLVKVEGRVLYHAGDLHWWHWEGEPDPDNREMAQRYQEEILTLKGEDIDAAFLPVDPRQEHNMLLGLDFFMRQIGARYVAPMHFWEDTSIFQRLQSDKCTEDYRGKIGMLAHAGQELEL